jgi:arsenite-transporting ATPase
MDRVADGLSQRTFLLPWLAQAPIGVAALSALVTP